MWQRFFVSVNDSPLGGNGWAAMTRQHIARAYMVRNKRPYRKLHRACTFFRVHDEVMSNLTSTTIEKQPDCGFMAAPGRMVQRRPSVGSFSRNIGTTI